MRDSSTSDMDRDRPTTHGVRNEEKTAMCMSMRQTSSYHGYLPFVPTSVDREPDSGVKMDEEDVYRRGEREGRKRRCGGQTASGR